MFGCLTVSLQINKFSNSCFDAIKKRSNTMTHVTYKDSHQTYFYSILITVLFLPSYFDYSMQFIKITSLLKQQQCSWVDCSPAEHLSHQPLTSLMSSHRPGPGNKNTTSGIKILYLQKYRKQMPLTNNPTDAHCPPQAGLCWRAVGEVAVERAWADYSQSHSCAASDAPPPNCRKLQQKRDAET